MWTYLPLLWPFGGGGTIVLGPFCAEAGVVYPNGIAAGLVTIPGGEAEADSDSPAVVGMVYCAGVAAGRVSIPGGEPCDEPDSPIVVGKVDNPGIAAGMIQCEMDPSGPDGRGL